jgi:hypothetical protein
VDEQATFDKARRDAWEKLFTALTTKMTIGVKEAKVEEMKTMKL